MHDPALGTVDADWAFDRYEAVRDRLVRADFPDSSIRVANLAALIDRFDAFVLDAFGVLNIGDTAIPGAVERIAELRAQNKRLIVLTNGATQSRSHALSKYHKFGFDFSADEVVASRDLAAAWLAKSGRHMGLWAAASGPDPNFSDLGDVHVEDLLADQTLYARADGFVLFSSAGWTPAHQARLADALKARPRPLLVANPDLVAPREDGFSLEPGHYAHALHDRSGHAADYFGKPFANAFDAVKARLEASGIKAERTAMVGDTLHTDILGGRAGGFGTVLITGHGLFKGLPVERYIASSGIVPDFIAPTT